MTYSSTISGLLDGAIKTGMNPVKRQYWPKFAFHFTDITNAVDILKRGLLVSRDYANRQHIMINDNASSDVIAQTKPEIKKFVRLYFRPRTPTQFY